MKLQFNQSGAWRQVMSFTCDLVWDVMESAEDLATYGRGTKMRITKDDGMTVVYSFDPTTGDWSEK